MLLKKGQPSRGILPLPPIAHVCSWVKNVSRGGTVFSCCSLGEGEGRKGGTSKKELICHNLKDIYLLNSISVALRKSLEFLYREKRKIFGQKKV